MRSPDIKIAKAGSATRRQKKKRIIRFEFRISARKALGSQIIFPTQTKHAKTIPLACLSRADNKAAIKTCIARIYYQAPSDTQKHEKELIGPAWLDLPFAMAVRIWASFPPSILLGHTSAEREEIPFRGHHR